jgi:Protein of unknown function (DUF669)
MATKKPARRKKGNVTTLDFTGVKSGGGAPPDGRYKAKIIEVSQEEGKDSGEPYMQLTWEITSDKCNGREVRFDNYSLQPQALWRVKSLLEAMGVEVPDGEHEVDWDELVSDETECIVELTGEARDGKTYARVTGHFPLEDGNTVDDDEDDKPARRKKPAKDDADDDDEPPKRRGKPADDDDDDDDEPPKRRGRKDDDDDADDDDAKPVRSKKIKKGAEVKFKNEKNKLVTGTIESIDGDQATVVTDDDDAYEIDLEELTVIG